MYFILLSTGIPQLYLRITFVKSSVGSYTPSSDRVTNANGNRVSDFIANDHFRQKLYKVGSIIGN